MRLATIIAVVLTIVKLAKSAPDPCMLDLHESSCDQTNYEAYKECVHNESKNEVRKKRQTPCSQNNPNNLDSLISIKENCQRANFDCRIACGDDEKCQSQCPVCPINVDELIASSNSSGDVNRTIIVENGQNVDKFETIHAGGNITTVIRLTNVINTSSSLSDLPQVDNGAGEADGEFGLGSNVNGSCCYVVEPKTCTSTSNGRKCHHRREKMCGKLCKAKVMHVSVRRRCNHKGCHKKISYIPQPKPPTCVHTRRWPYVACGQLYTSNCDGCYDHYTDSEMTNDENNDCDGCYDDGFEYGPLYRQGPVLRPYFYHVPPCYIVGNCLPYTWSHDYDYYDHYYHGRGNNRHRYEYVDDEDEVDFEDFEDTANEKSTPTNKTDEGAADWAIEVHKCKVVSDNGTIEIRNCTAEDIQENPYAGGPPDVSYYDEDEDYDGVDDNVRIQRHAKPHQSHRSQVVYIPVLQNINDDAMNDDYDFVDAPRRHRRNRHSKSSPKHHQRKAKYIYDDDEDDPQN